jgi:hypothetical protein
MPANVRPQAASGAGFAEALVEEGRPACGAAAAAVARTPRKKQTERRAEQRYDLRLSCELYRYVGEPEPVRAGTGKTAMWSRHSVLIQTAVPLTEGDRLQVVTDWMFGIKLVVSGRVIRCDQRGAVVEVQRPHFQGSAADYWNREVGSMAAGSARFSGLDLTPRA